MKLFVVCLLCLLDFGYVIGKEITYYIGIREINWDYAPSGMNTISGKSIDDDEHASTFLQPGPNRIGRVYKKAVYLQYTDDSYAEEMKKPNWLGFLGPIMTAEVGDTMTIHLKNFASRPYTLHPHGVQYTKENEGAIYPDNSSKAQNKGDAVKPGESYTYTWDVVEDQGPTDWVEDCVTRVYHSHIDGPRDVYSGLVGPLIICKEGVRDGAKAKKYEEFILMFSVIDENLSWYLDDNINSYCTDPASVDKEDEDFQESNLMHSINGYMYGNLPGLSMCDNTKIKWYLFGMGNEVDIHSAYFHGQVLTHQRFRVDTLSLFPATMIEGEMITKNPGKWLLSCQVNDHLEGGMQAIYEVKNCTGKSKCSNCHWGVVRHYYIAAEEIIWDYGPTSINQFTGQKLDHPDSESATFFERGEKRIGGRYKKVVYIEYTDSTFTKRKERSSEEAHLGILGPVILAQVGDFIKVTFKNNASRPYSIQAHGVSYTKDMEGAVYKTDNNEELNTQSQASHVDPGDVFTYEWNVPRNVGSTIHDLNCLPWLYYSSVDVVRDTNSGLVGPLLVCMTLINNKQRGVAHNYFVMPNVFDENKSWYLEENIKLFTSSPHTVNKEDADFQESNMMHSINGYMYGNQPGLDMCTGDSIRWSMIGLGTEVDMHGIHFSGNTIQVHDVTRDVASVFPHISYAVIMNPDNEGVFDVECMTTDHYTGGMRQQYRVKSCNKQTPKVGISPIRTYYIAAEEIEWDYSPSRTWVHERHSFHAESPADIFLNKSRTSIGSKYKKAVYREYTDNTFTARKERTANQEHLGILGPLIKANTGDEIHIIFKNKASRPYSMYAHGIMLADNEIKPAEPGHIVTYIWKIPNRSGPNRHEGDCVTWAYYSTVDQTKDLYSGLIGPLVICKKILLPFFLPRVSPSRFALLFMVFNENESWYLDENIKTYSNYPDEVKKDDEKFVESNLMHGINGRMYANLPGLTMHVGDDVMWHLIGLGNEVDIHTVHFHAHSFEYKTGVVYRSDVFDLFPGTFQTVKFTAKNPGTWLLHCHVSYHIHSGMEALYTVLEKKETLKKLLNLHLDI
ncbi:ceruloplasmin-like isoform X1 [Pseudophryne corroboree]|uniref:ceruloplasmin-like isoform X1 n=1 Tax=Pseudophryne corroboree TaxID=495146 RepID=UPI0030821678